MAKQKQIIFCQGDKEELEEITGEEYEYLIPAKVLSQTYLENKKIWPTFFGCHYKGKQNKTILDEMYDKALNVGADAVIHYKETTFVNSRGKFNECVYGTFLGLKARKPNL